MVITVLNAILFCAIMIANYQSGEVIMEAKLKMAYWKGEKFWVGKLIEYPDVMTQGETLAELEENMKDAYLLMTMDDVPVEHKVKELTIAV